MIKNTLYYCVIALLISVMVLRSASAEPRNPGQQLSVEQVKMKIEKLGIGEKARVKVRHRDKRELRGYISEVRGDDFVITDAETKAKIVIAYSDVEKVKDEPPLSPKARAIALGVFIGALFLVATAAITPST